MISSTQQTETLSNGSSGVCLNRLNLAQKEAIRLLAEGRSPAQTAKQLNVARSTVHRWIKGDEVFQDALRQAQAQFESEVDEEAHIFKKAMKTPLFTPEGIRVRMELIDHLLLQDLKDKDSKRASLIKRLEDSLKQAGSFIGKLDADEVASDLLQQRTFSYRQKVLEAVWESLQKQRDRDRLIQELQTRLDEIDTEAGIE